MGKLIIGVLACGLALAQYSPPSGGGGGGGGATIPSTTNVIKGDGSGNGADSKVAITAPTTAATIQFAADNETVILPSGTMVPNTRTVAGHALSSNVTVSASDVGLGSVTNDAQTKAAIVPNTAPSAGQVPCGNAGGTAYAPCTVGGDATIASTGALTIKTSVSLAGSPTTTTQSQADNSTKIATTAYVDTGLSAKGAGNAAAKVTTTFNASTMTFTCSSNTINDFVLSTALTANVTASAVDSCNSGILTFTLTQDSTGGRSFAWPTGFSSAVPPSPIASASTKETFYFDGTNYILLAVSVDSGPNAFGVETAAPGTPPSGDFYWWGDSTNHIFSYKANNSATVSNTVVPDTGASNNFLTAISAAGVVSKARPTCGNLSDSTALCSTSPGTGVATFLGTPSSANLAAALTDETGSGAAVFGTGAALANAVLNTSSSLGTSAGSGLYIPGSSLTAGTVYYQASGGLTAAKADTSTTVPAICIAISTTQCAYAGTFRFSSSQSWTAGQILYVSDASAGAIVNSAPTTSAHYIQRIGVALANDTIQFMPSIDVGGIQ